MCRSSFSQKLSYQIKYNITLFSISAKMNWFLSSVFKLCLVFHQRFSPQSSSQNLPSKERILRNEIHSLFNLQKFALEAKNIINEIRAFPRWKKSHFSISCYKEQNVVQKYIISTFISSSKIIKNNKNLTITRS